MDNVKKTILEALASVSLALGSAAACLGAEVTPEVNAMITAGPCTSPSAKDIIAELIGFSSALSTTHFSSKHKPRKTVNKPLRMNKSQKYKS